MVWACVVLRVDMFLVCLISCLVLLKVRWSGGMEMDRVTRGEDHETDGYKEGGLSPVTLHTQGTIIHSDRSIRFAGKAGIRPVGKAGARV